MCACAGSYSLIHQHIRETDPRAILRDLLPETILPPDLDDMTLWQIIINISEPPKRKKRKDVNTVEDVVRLLHESKRIMVLTGAGVGVSVPRRAFSAFMLGKETVNTGLLRRFQFPVEFPTFAPEMGFTLGLLSTFPTFPIRSRCSTSNTSDETPDRFSSLLRLEGFFCLFLLWSGPSLLN